MDRSRLWCYEVDVLSGFGSVVYREERIYLDLPGYECIVVMVVYSSRIGMESGGMVVWVHLSLLALGLFIVWG